MTIQELAEDWKRGGIGKGDTVLLHSSLRRTFKRYLKRNIRLTPEMVLESFLVAIGDDGTLILPLFNFDFTKGVPFNIRTTPSQMGLLTEAARIRSDAVRTGHPIYSFAAIGSRSSMFMGVDNYSGYGENSPFAMLRNMNGKIAILNLPDQNSMTFYHHVEEMNGVDYRYQKEFSGEYIDLEGVPSFRTYGLFVRDIEKGVLTDVNSMGDLLWQEGIYHGVRYNQDYGLRTVDANQLYKCVSEVISTGRAEGLLYRIEGDQNG